MQQSVSLLSLSKQTQLLLLPVGQEVDVSTEEEGGGKNVWSSISKGLKCHLTNLFFLFLLRLEFLFLTQHLINDSLHLDLKLTDLPLLSKAEEGVMSSPRPGEDLKRKVRGH